MIAELAVQGIGVDGRMVGPDGYSPAAFSERSPVAGLMVEYVHESLRAAVDDWIENGPTARTTASAPADE